MKATYIYSVSEREIYKKRTFETLPQGCVTFFIQNRKGKKRKELHKKQSKKEKNCTRKKVRKKRIAQERK